MSQGTIDLVIKSYSRFSANRETVDFQKQQLSIMLYEVSYSV